METVYCRYVENRELECGDLFVTINGAQYTYTDLSMKRAAVQDSYWGPSAYERNWDGGTV